MKCGLSLPIIPITKRYKEYSKISNMLITHSQILQIEAEMEKEHFFSENLSFSYRMLAPIMWSSLVDTSLYRYDFSGNRFISPTGRGELGFYPNQSNNFQQDFQHIANFKYVLKTNHALNLNTVYRLSKNRPDDPLANDVCWTKYHHFSCRPELKCYQSEL